MKVNKPAYWTCLCLLGASLAEANWPRWRGPNEDGMALGDAAVTWTTERNVRWKTHIPGRGHSSPVIWGDRIFVTTAVPIGEPAPAAEPAPAPGPGGFGGKKGGGGAGGGAGPAVEHKFVLMCVDKKSGKVLWERAPRTVKPHEGYHRQYGSHASNSPVTDGKRVWAFFGSRGLYAYDLEGKLLWEKDFDVRMRMRLSFGEGSAPLLAEDILVLKFDQESGSFVVAVDANTGKELWRQAREEQSSWSQPFAVKTGGATQVVVSASNKTRSYDLRTGKLIWEASGLGSNVIPAPVHLNGVVFVMSGHRDPNLQAIRLGRTGDLTGTDAILWTNQRGNSYSASPVLHDNKLYFVSDNGMLSCLNAQTGEPYYLQQRLGAYQFKSSPVGAGGKLYLATEQGDVVVVKMGEKFEVLSVNKMDDQFFVATPAIAGGDLILRSQNTLFCIRE
jgi:outer membrane protein assembly factor BamB